MSSLKENASVTGLAALLAFAVVPAAFVTSPFEISPSIPAALAHYTNRTVRFPSPTSVPNGLKVRIDGDSSMVFINQALAQRFENQFPATEIVSNYAGTEAALQAVLDDQIDLAVISRLLTDTEKALGLVDVPLTRHKIAMIVGADNPFKGDLTIRQFAEIFRGELTNWAEVGGPVHPIRKVDRPHSSDTRRAFQNYGIFQAGAFETGDNAITLQEDSTETVIKRLGRNGISYAIAVQVQDNPDVRIVPMHDVLPDDARYPFSQPLSYVYKGPTPTPAAQAFLGYAIDPANESVVESARVKGALAEIAGELALSSTTKDVVDPEGTSSNQSAASKSDDTDEETVAQAPAAGGVAIETDSPFSLGGWLIIFLLLGIPLLLWLITHQRSPVALTTIPKKSRLILVPRGPYAAFAYWETDKTTLQALKQQGGRRHMLRLYDVSNIDPKHQTPHYLKQVECDEHTSYKHLSIHGNGRKYFAELGYITSQGKWLLLASSDKVSMPVDPADVKRQNMAAEIAADPPVFEGPVKVASPSSPTEKPLKPISQPIVNAAPSPSPVEASKPVTKDAPESSSPAVSLTPSEPESNESSRIKSNESSRIILTLCTFQLAYAYWEVPQAVKAFRRESLGQPWTLQIHDVTDIDVDHQAPHFTQAYPCDDQTQDMHVTIPRPNRDYLADLGYVTKEDQWVSVVRSLHIRAPLEG
ncbi:MAG: DUF4912 domain-containing protein [Leptolyngbyaceae cyanobacterium MO_188.B28]|nr:DUF4912 domain-containing protein [Leptolyngbyaceae cyanobacterium MO_188.B28]